jgi:hypothetical protein
MSIIVVTMNLVNNVYNSGNNGTNKKNKKIKKIIAFEQSLVSYRNNSKYSNVF